MYDVADSVSSLPVWDKDGSTLHLGVIQMSSWISQRTLVDSMLSLSWEIVLTVFLACLFIDSLDVAYSGLGLIFSHDADSLLGRELHRWVLCRSNSP